MSASEPFQHDGHRSPASDEVEQMLSGSVSHAAANCAARWFLVNAQTGRESLAEQHLRRQTYETFLPRAVRTIGKGHRARRTIASYFPGYLFVRLDLSVQRWRPIDSTIGVMRIVKVGERPSPAPVGLVEGIRDLVGPSGLYEPAPQDLSVGDQVKVVHGPFAAHLAVVERLDGPGRVRVLLTLMKQAIPVSMSAADLVAA